MELTLKSTVGPAEQLDIDFHIDRAQRIVRLDMLEFDADLVISFLTDELLREQAIRVDGLESGQPSPEQPYQLVITLAGRPHPARLAQRSDGRYVLRLLDPDAAYLTQCQLAIAHLLSALQERDIEAFITGIDARGRPAPNEGFLHLFARARSDGQEQEVEELRKETEQRFSVSVCVLRLTNSQGQLDHVRSMEAHFEWDPSTQQVVRRGPRW